VAFSDLGDLDKSKFGFAVMLRQNDCNVFAAGCTDVDLDQHRHITIQIGQYPDYTACNASKNEQCMEGICTTPSAEAGVGDGGTEGGDGSTDGGDTDGSSESSTSTCDLKLIMADNLAMAVEDGSTVVGPVAIATPSGFIIAYREINGTGSNAIATRVPISDQGVKSQAVQTPQNACDAGMPDSRGITAAWNVKSDAGMMCAATPACDADAGTTMFVGVFDEKGDTKSQQIFPPPDNITLPLTAGASAVPDDTTYYLSAIVGTTPFIYTLDPVKGIQSFTKMNENITTATFAQVSASAGIVAATANPNVVDGGADGGAVALAVGTAPKTLSSLTYLDQASFAALTTASHRALAVVPTSKGLSYIQVDETGKALTTSAKTLAGGPFASIAAASLNSHAFVAAGTSKGLTVYRLDGMTATITDPSVSTKQSLTVGNVSLANYDGSTISIVAARKRVIVSWLSSKTGASTTKPVGGYAVFGCDG
jgi:hypothetical protein